MNRRTMTGQLEMLIAQAEENSSERNDEVTIYNINGYGIEHGGRGKWYATITKEGAVIADRAPVVWEHDTTSEATVVWYPGTNAGTRHAQALAAADRPLVAIAKGTRLEGGLMKFDGFVGLARVNAKRKPWRRMPSPSKRLLEELSCTVDIIELLGCAVQS